ncbi:tRNA methyl transferase PRC-barrel domain-containing protein, partial [Acetomicrobium mobile]
GIFGDMFSDVRESVDLCFLSERKTLRNFISAKIKAKKGPIISSQGDLLGYHEGAVFYTVGQREGLGLSNGPWYVLSVKEHDNTLIVGRKTDLYRRTIKCLCPHWLERPKIGEAYTAQHRYKTTPKPVVLSHLDKHEFTVEALESPLWGVAPGQSLVIYDREVVMGGGIIADSTNSSS